MRTEKYLLSICLTILFLVGTIGIVQACQKDGESCTGDCCDGSRCVQVPDNSGDYQCAKGFWKCRREGESCGSSTQSCCMKLECKDSTCSR